jgi:hypothetical protein
MVFTKEVQCKITTPLAPRPTRTRKAAPQATGKPALPKRSERLANHPLANVASSKRAEVVLMRRFDVLQDSKLVNSDAKRAYRQFDTERRGNYSQRYGRPAHSWAPIIHGHPCLMDAAVVYCFTWIKSL